MPMTNSMATKAWKAAFEEAGPNPTTEKLESITKASPFTIQKWADKLGVELDATSNVESKAQVEEALVDLLKALNEDAQIDIKSCAKEALDLKRL